MHQTNIQWTDFTFNLWIGCEKVSPACQFCYAEKQDRFRGWTSDGWGPGRPRHKISDERIRGLINLNRRAGEAGFAECAACGKREFRGRNEHGLMHCKGCGSNRYRIARPRVFCFSLADWLDTAVPIDWFAEFLQLIHTCRSLDFLLLTKRPYNFQQRMLAALSHYRGPAEPMIERWAKFDEPPGNVWVGATVENRQTKSRIPHLLEIPAAKRFLSMEPLLENPGLSEGYLLEIDWVICGGESESKANARPFDLAWANSILRYCEDTGVAFFMKQLGRNPVLFGQPVPDITCPKGSNPEEWPDHLRVRQFPVATLEQHHSPVSGSSRKTTNR